MKILLTADPTIPVPPVFYGGIERIIDGLISEFVERGHEVILIAHPDSSCSAAVRIYNWKGLKASNKVDIFRNALQLRQVYLKEKPDILHSFSRLLYLYPLLLGRKTKIIQSYQRAINHQSTFVASLFGGKRIVFTACGAHMFAGKGYQGQWESIHNFTDTDYFQDDPNSAKNHLFFLGRIEDIKGTREAIQIAQACKESLIIAGNIPKGKEDYFKGQVEPYLNEQIKYVGPVNDSQKRKWLQSSKAFLFPIKWEEPFGIVQAEALACGVPVLGTNFGAVPEVVEDEHNGFVRNTWQELATALKDINNIKREDCRKQAVQKFSRKSIGEKYLNLYKSIIS